MKYNYEEICSNIEKDGYCLIDKFWSKELDEKIEMFYQKTLEPLVKNTSIDKFGNRAFALADEEIDDNPFNLIKNSDEFTKLCKNILKINKINVDKNLDIHNVIALQKNEQNTNLGISSKLHFDAFFLTIII